MGLFRKSKKELLNWQKIISPGTNKLVFTERQLGQHSKTRVNQSMKIIQDSIHLCNTTKKPDVFFKRWDLLISHMTILADLEKYVKFSGDSPGKALIKIQTEKYDSIDKLIDRVWNEYLNKINSLKTTSAKHKKLETFKEDLDNYAHLMSQENIAKYKSLYNNYSAEK